MEEFVTKDILRLRIPFEDLYTSVFIVTTPEGTAVLDCATTRDDVKRYILPALSERGLVPKLIFASHSHGDHMGGMPCLAEHFPNALPVMLPGARAEAFPSERRHIPENGERLLGCLRVLPLPGHSPDSAAILDERTRTLLTFDCLQAQGVGRFGTGVSDVADYLESIEVVSRQNIEILAASHEYIPVGAIAVGAAAISNYLAACRADVETLCNFICASPQKSNADVAADFNAAHPAHPPISANTVRAFVSYLNRN